MGWTWDKHGINQDYNILKHPCPLFLLIIEYQHDAIVSQGVMEMDVSS
jgi:hypothetical protein